MILLVITPYLTVKIIIMFHISIEYDTFIYATVVTTYTGQNTHTQYINYTDHLECVYICSRLPALTFPLLTVDRVQTPWRGQKEPRV